MTHLIRDPSFFWTFTQDSSVSMKTANQGSLDTKGYGDCMAVLKLGGRRIRLRLQHCLYAPNAVVNLLSVGRMVERGWDVRFRGGPSRCELAHEEVVLGSVDMKAQLCFLDIEFIRPSGTCGMRGWGMQGVTLRGIFQSQQGACRSTSLIRPQRPHPHALSSNSFTQTSAGHFRSPPCMGNGTSSCSSTTIRMPSASSS